jgi:predicted nucleic acid-binding protein
VKGIADTGFVVAFLNRRDAHHRWAVRLAEQVTAPLVTCEAVLAEAAFQCESVRSVMALVRERLLRVDFDLEEDRDRIEVLAKRYEDRDPDLADLCLICLSERLRDWPVITVDTDFRIYRRHQREVIPVLMPPE